MNKNDQTSEVNQTRIDKMSALLTNHLSPSSLEIVDESYLHAGHEGAKSGKGHFSLSIASKNLDGLTALKQHQEIYAVLGELMHTDIHALRINVTKAI